jgi:hypothetical protein
VDRRVVPPHNVEVVIGPQSFLKRMPSSFIVQTGYEASDDNFETAGSGREARAGAAGAARACIRTMRSPDLPRSRALVAAPSRLAESTVRLRGQLA